MAEIPYPARAWRTAWSMQVDPFGLEVHESEFTGEESYVVNAAGRWRGTFTLAAVDAADRDPDPDIAAEIAAWAGGLAGGDTTRVPIPPGYPTLPTGTTRRVTGISAAGAIQYAGPLTVKNGDLLRVGDRIYRVRDSALGAGRPTVALAVVPYGIGLRRSRVIGADIVPADSILVRAAGEIPDSADAEFSGPWVVPWVESAP